MACFRPFRPFGSRALGFPAPAGAAHESTKAAILSCTSTPPRRIHLTRAARLPTSCVDRNPPSANASHRPLCPTAFPEPGTLFCARPFGPAFRKRCPASGKSRLKGLATLLTRVSPGFLGGLFQSPTLMGFSLQSFSPPGRSGARYRVPFRPCAFPQDPIGLAPALRRVPPAREAVPLIASRGVSPDRGRVLS